MAKVKKGNGKSKNNPKAGDTYVLKLDSEVQDVNADGITDLVVTHQTLKNGELMVEGKVVWYGLDPTALTAFESAIEKFGLVDGQIELSSFKKVVHEWKKITEFFKHINQFGEKVADEVDE